MVITKDPLDGPPAYDSLPPSSPSSRPAGDQKRPLPYLSTSGTAGPSRPPIPLVKEGEGRGGGGGTWGVLSGEWWKRRKEEEEIRRTVRALLKDVIHNLSDPSSLDVLYSSHAACASHGISFPQLSQEPIEGHPPLYWAVLTLSPQVRTLPGGSLNCPPPAGGWQALDLLTGFELNEKTQREGTAACVLGDDNALFQYLRGSAGFAPRGLAESIVARSSVASASGSSGTSVGGAGEDWERREVDTVWVEHVPDGKAGHFRMRARLTDWLRRMRMHKKVQVRWIARGRAWQLMFAISEGHNPYSSGTWYCAISLLPHTGSSSTALSALIQLGTPSPPPSSPEDLLTSPTPFAPPRGGEGERPKTVTLKITKSNLEEYDFTGAYVKLSDTPGAASLEYEDSPFIDAEGAVWVEGDFVLEKN